MATIPFSCHQQFIWCHVDDKLSFIKDYLSLISSTGQRTVVLAQDTNCVCNVVSFLWDCGIPVVYHHSGHLGNQDRLAQVMDSYLSTSRPVIISQEGYCHFPFYHTATRVLVVDFPNSIDCYRDYKTLIDFNSHKGLVTALVSQNESHLLPKLKDYILQKGEHPPLWLVQEPVTSHKLANPTGGVSSIGDNFSHGNIKSFPSCPVMSNKPERRNPPPKPPFIGPNILDRPLAPDPEKSWNEVGVSTLHPQSNSCSTWPSQERVSREVTYRYGPLDIGKGIGLSALNSNSLIPDSHKYDYLLSKHLSSTRRKSPTKSQSSSISHHNLEYKSQSYASNHPPVTNTDNWWDRSNSLVSKQLGPGLVPPLDPPSLCEPQSSMHFYCGSISTQPHGSHDLVPSRSVTSQDPILPMLPQPKAIVPRVATTVPIVDNNPSSYSDSEDEDSNDNTNSPFNGNNDRPCSSDNTDNVGSLCGPGVPHADITKHTSCSSLYQPGLVRSERSSCLGKIIAVGLGSPQDTISRSDSLAILPNNRGILYNSNKPSSLDVSGENISHSSAFPTHSHITQQVMSGLIELPYEDVSSPFSLVDTDIPSSNGGTVPIVDLHPAHCGMVSSEHKDSSLSSSNKLSSTQYVPGNAINGNTPGEPLGNVDTLNNQLNHKGLVSMASDQPQ